MRHQYLLAILISTVFAGAASAQTSPSSDKVPAAFAKMDTNHDGVLSLEEWKAAGRRERGFKMIDANSDGKVTIDELQAARAKYGRGG